MYVERLTFALFEDERNIDMRMLPRLLRILCGFETTLYPVLKFSSSTKPSKTR